VRRKKLLDWRALCCVRCAGMHEFGDNDEGETLEGVYRGSFTSLEASGTSLVVCCAPAFLGRETKLARGLAGGRRGMQVGMNVMCGIIFPSNSPCSSSSHKFSGACCVLGESAFQTELVVLVHSF